MRYVQRITRATAPPCAPVVLAGTARPRAESRRGGAPTKDGAGRSVPTIAQRNVTVYSRAAIRSFRHKGLQRFFETGSKAGIQASHAKRLARMLSRLDAASQPRDLNVPGWHLHALTGDLAGHWSLWVSGNWRLTFAFDGQDVILLDYQDYH
jgi:proteic killer suppression protein